MARTDARGKKNAPAQRMILFRYPARTGGVVLGGAAATIITVNALFMQDGNHPAPMFSTRPAATALAPSDLVPSPAPAAVPMPSPRATPRPVQTVAASPPTVAPPVRQPATSDRALIEQIQASLTALGLYRDTVDGIFGSRTRAAIEAYQRQAGIPVTGEPSESLALRLVVATPDAGQTGSIPRPDEGLLSVERALNDLGYGPVRADGVADADTGDAIRRFELDNGLAITGTANQAVVQKLVQIGALAAI
jgi:peptidoglycan hydrolase-like protein with peptidoglycan-binding domain